MPRSAELSRYSRLIDMRELRLLVPYSRTQFWRLEKLGLFPARIRLGPGRVAWSLGEVQDWIRRKKEGGDWNNDEASEASRRA